MSNFVSISPVFSSDNIPKLLEHYKRLGFDVKPYEGDVYGFATREGITIHFSLNPEHDSKKTAGCAYLYVKDAERLAKEWEDTGCGRTIAPVDTDYGLREGAHIDPQGNLIRFGSPRSVDTPAGS